MDVPGGAGENVAGGQLKQQGGDVAVVIAFFAVRRGARDEAVELKVKRGA